MAIVLLKLFIGAATLQKAYSFIVNIYPGAKDPEPH